MNDEWYFFGVLCVLIFNIYRILFSIYKINSTQAKNLEKIGVFYDFLTLKYSKYSPETINTIIIKILYFLLISPLFSWLVFINIIINYIILNIYKKEYSSYKDLIKSMSKKT